MKKSTAKVAKRNKWFPVSHLNDNGPTVVFWIRENINGRHNFSCIYCIGLLTIDEKGYSYSVTVFAPEHPNTSLTYVVSINNEFTGWEIAQI